MQRKRQMLMSADPAAVSVSGCSAAEAENSKPQPSFRTAAFRSFDFISDETPKEAACSVSGVLAVTLTL